MEFPPVVSQNLPNLQVTMMIKAVALLGLLASTAAFTAPSVVRQSVKTHAITSKWSMDEPAPEVSERLERRTFHV